MPRAEDTGLVELSQMFGVAPDVTRGGGQDYPPYPPNLELRSINKFTPPPSQLPLGALLTTRSSPPPALVGAADFSAFCPPLPPPHTHPLSRYPNLPPPGWLGRDLINPQTAREGT